MNEFFKQQPKQFRLAPLQNMIARFSFWVARNGQNANTNVICVSSAGDQKRTHTGTILLRPVIKRLQQITRLYCDLFYKRNVGASGGKRTGTNLILQVLLW